MDRLRALEVFVEVVRKEGFARAADALDTSPANVTRYVSELETHLQTRLLNRSSRRMSLTPSGETLFDRARAILDEVAETEALVSSAAIQPRGVLRINAPLSFGVLHLAPLWPRFMERYPDVQLDISLTDRVVDLVDEGYDMAVRISRAGAATVVARKLAVCRSVLCAAPSYLARRGAPASPADLAHHDCIGYSYHSTGSWLLQDSGGAQHPVKPRFILHTNNGDTARAVALGGQGIIAQPTFLIGDDVRGGRLAPVLPGYTLPEIDIQAVYPSRRHVSARVRVMVDFLAEAFSGTPAWDRALAAA